MKLLLIDWIDAVGGKGDWTDISTLKERTLPTIQSVGFLILETDELVALSPHIDSENELGFGEITIPKSQIKKRKVLK